MRLFKEELEQYFVKSSPYLVIRHDLDEADILTLNKLKKLEDELKIHSTWFALWEQLSDARFESLFKQAESESWEIALHSEALFGVESMWNVKTRNNRIQRFFNSARKIRRQFLSQLNQWDYLYQKGLFIQKTDVQPFGYQIEGHAPHSKNCYLPLEINQTWDLIEQSSCKAGFNWMSSFRQVMKTLINHTLDFDPPSSLYKWKNKLNPDLNTLVIDTGWCDSYLIDKPKGTFDGAIKSIRFFLESLVQNQNAAAICFHPVHFIGPKAKYDDSLFSKTIQMAKSLGIHVGTARNLVNSIK